ncbi:hypothetical protein AVEN_185062-1 [Araneus ventricosus]|uniref:Uncharacterized protein n=1 Tax=Araneus ventricosus TaxID=182803 RepID=A0A4Y2BPW6_ARAVE|nr:hypothetical protein AVEN_185062-1 [Araneus ventricosus]
MTPRFPRASKDQRISNKYEAHIVQCHPRRCLTSASQLFHSTCSRHRSHSPCVGAGLAGPCLKNNTLIIRCFLLPDISASLSIKSDISLVISALGKSP